MTRQCAQCGGLWIGAGAFARVCSDREAQAVALAMAVPLPPPVAADEHVHYLQCPQCSRLMNRVNYAHRSRVIVDVCRPHGVWLDRDELRRIIEFIRAGGLDLAREAEKEDLQRERQRLEALQRIGNTGDQAPSSFGGGGSSLGDDLLWGIGQVLGGLLG
jgi:Zn-finger nucleic acid-binding protein